MGIRAMAVHEYGKTHSAHETLLFAAKMLGLDASAYDGGPGSGNFGHAGRPGKRGGSAKGSGGAAMRSGSKETGFTSFAKSEAFKGIASSAKASSDYREFVKNMSGVQKEALRAQRQACGTSESMQTYAERIYSMLSKRNGIGQVRQENKPVDGKDILDTWTYQGEQKRPEYSDNVSTKAIDTDIEDVLHQQGFDGVPKVVSQAEFNRIVKEHPEMPILMRSYAAQSEEQLKQFDEDLEKGWFYVDCGTGGAGFGQGMYTAGIYQQEPLYEWNDPNMELDDSGAPFVFTFKQDGFKATKVDNEENTEAGDLWVDIPYLVEDKKGNRRMIKQDLDSGIWEDIGNGGIVDEKEVDKYLKTGKVYECRETDIGIYKDANDKERKEGIKRAREEMAHYRNLNIGRILENNTPQAPDGKNRATSTDFVENTDSYFYYEPQGVKTFKDGLPENGKMIAIMNTRDTGFSGIDAAVYQVDGDDLVSLDRRTRFKMDPESVHESWAYIEGRCPDPPELHPKATTRVMTLDPSAKIITHQELKSMKMGNEGFLSVERDKKLKEYAKAHPEAEGIIENYPIASEMKKTEWMKTEEGRKAVEFSTEVWEEYNKQVRRFQKARHLDDGVFAALLGYDAINAEGHGQTGSYTVVLNRTKVIISEDPVDIE